MRERSLSWSGWQGRGYSLAEPYRATKTSRQLVVAQISTTVTTGGRRACEKKNQIESSTAETIFSTPATLSGPMSSFVERLSDTKFTVNAFLLFLEAIRYNM